MKLMTWRKDGGQKSRVHGFFVVEIKSLFTIVILHFYPGTRDAYHSHAFGAVSWLFTGRLNECAITTNNKTEIKTYTPSLLPIWTPRSRLHQVESVGHSWALSFRGPWTHMWNEITEDREAITLTHGRKVVS
jgi:hypothetical protein